MAATRTPITYKDPITLQPVLVDAVQPAGAGTPSQAIHEIANSSGNLIDPATDESVQQAVTALGSILAKLGTKLSVSIDGDSVSITLPPGLALDATGQSAVTALNTLISDVSNNHADLTAIHVDTGTTLHSDLVALLTRIGQPLTVGGTVAVLNPITGFALDATLQSIKTSLGNPAQAGGAVSVSNFPATQAVSASALPLPSGAAKDTSLTSILSALQSALTVQGAVTANLGTVAGLGLDASLQAILGQLKTTLIISAASLPLPTGAATAAGQVTGNTSLAAIQSSLSAPIKTMSSGGVGTDFSANLSANSVTVPNVGAAFSASGPYSGYTLVQTLPANPNRAYAEVDNLSTGQILIVRDDGTAVNGAAPANASLIPIYPAPQTGAPGGGGWTSSTFKGRLQIYAPANSTPLISAFQD